MKAIDLLREKNVKVSSLRIKILDYILNHRTHPTVDEIYEELLKENPTLSKTTVYNATKLLLEHGLILQILIDGQQVRYDGDISKHGHFMCDKCKSIYDFKVLTEPEIKLDGFEVSDLKIYCSGLCEKCKI